MDKNTVIKKIEMYSLYIGFIGIFVGIWLPVFNYISTGAFALTYVTALIKQKLQKGKIKFLSFLLCTASLTWVLLRQFTDSPYVVLLGQCILYCYLANTQKELLGKVDRKFAFFAVCAVGLGCMRIYYPSKLTNVLNMLMQLWILFRFLDPVLENIGQAHRRKRLAEEAAKAAAEKNGEIVQPDITENEMTKDQIGGSIPRWTTENTLV